MSTIVPHDCYNSLPSSHIQYLSTIKQQYYQHKKLDHCKFLPVSACISFIFAEEEEFKEHFGEMTKLTQPEKCEHEHKIYDHFMEQSIKLDLWINKENVKIDTERNSAQTTVGGCSLIYFVFSLRTVGGGGDKKEHIHVYLLWWWRNQQSDLACDKSWN